MGQPTRITLPPSGRPVGGLLSAARPIGGEWWRGLKFTSGQCLAPQVLGTCPPEPVEKDLQDLSGESAFEAFNIIQAVRCTTMGNTDVAAFADQSLDVTREYGLAGEFLSGAASGNPSLVDADNVGVAANPVEALACLEALASVGLSGRMVFFHVAPQIGTHLLAEAAIWRDGRLWRSALGNVVVISPGYDGRAPGSTGPVENGDELFIYATGEVYAEVGQRETIRSVDRSINDTQAWAEDAGLVIFDPCFNIAMDTGLESCTPVVS